MRKNRILRQICLLLFCVSIFAQFTAQAVAGGFTIKAVIPENQVDEKQTYFDLRMSPGQEQEIEVQITNSRDEELVAQVRLCPATTGSNGTIIYTEPELGESVSGLSITDVASLGADLVRIPAQGSGTVKINLKMPKEGFSGIILGGISVSAAQQAQKSEAETEKQGISLQNTITYVIALKLSESEALDNPDFDLVSVEPSLVNYRTAVVAKLSNKAARLVKGMNVHAQVFRRGNSLAHYELVLDAAEMAPMSKGDFVIDWNGEPLQKGEYRLKMTADYEGRRWEWDEDFLIGDKAKEINSGALWLNQSPAYLYALIIVAALILAWIILRRSRVRRRGRSY